eukprot:m.16864 g.16864  ORF g.16864 m.16864 type:complete len:889 (-) comp3542_c0_seq1:1263-3929(-)
MASKGLVDGAATAEAGAEFLPDTSPILHNKSFFVAESLQPDLRRFARVMFLTCLNMVLATCFFLLFGGPGIGYGAEIFRALYDHYSKVDDIIVVSAGILFLLYLFDVSYWQGRWLIVKQVLVTLAILGLASALVLAARNYPGAPVALYLLLVPLYIYAAKRLLYPSLGTASFLRSIGYSLILTSIAVLGVWIWWVFDRYRWTATTKQDFADEMLCENVDDCLAAYVLWISPFLAAVNSIVFAVLSLLVARSIKAQDQPITTAMRVFAGLLLLCIVGIWVAASVAGAGMRVSNAVNLFVAAGLCMFAGILVSTVGWKAIHAQLLSIPIIRKISAKVLSNWMKALFLIVLGPVIPIYLALSFLNQRFRVWFSCTKSFESAEESSLWLTLRAHNQVEKMKSWRWVSVFRKIAFIGLFYVIINVGVGKLTTLFLSWLNGEMASFSFGVVTAIFFVIGLIMFLLPPVPGVPVYLAGGVILVASARESLGFWGATTYSSFICFFIKLMAIACQQKLIGERMADNLSVRKLVGVNSITIKAIEKILKKPGLARDKVSILIGGPDWPTSVLTGILRLPLFEMLIGSTPVLFLVIPCVCAGAFLLRVADGGSWESISSVTLAVAAMVQLVAMITAAYYIEQVAENHREELEALPKDQEVLESSRKDRLRKDIYNREANWHAPHFPLWAKIVLVLGAFCSAMACYLIVAFPTKTFEAYEVTDTISDRLDGNALNIVTKPLGWVVIGLTVMTIVFLKVFSTWASRRVRDALEDQLLTNPETAEAVVSQKSSRRSSARLVQNYTADGDDLDGDADEGDGEGGDGDSDSTRQRSETDWSSPGLDTLKRSQTVWDKDAAARSTTNSFIDPASNNEYELAQQSSRAESGEYRETDGAVATDAL